MRRELFKFCDWFHTPAQSSWRGCTCFTHLSICSITCLLFDRSTLNLSHISPLIWRCVTYFIFLEISNLSDWNFFKKLISGLSFYNNHFIFGWAWSIILVITNSWFYLKWKFLYSDHRLGWSGVTVTLLSEWYFLLIWQTLPQWEKHWMNFAAVYRQGWGLLSQFPPFHYFPNFSPFVKTLVTYCISRSYLTGVTTAQLWWHLSNMNMI